MAVLSPSVIARRGLRENSHRHFTPTANEVIDPVLIYLCTVLHVVNERGGAERQVSWLHIFGYYGDR